MLRYLTLLSMACAAAGSAWGHHSDAGMDTNAVVAFEGAVTEVRWRNPHVYINVETADERGEQVEWTLQMGSTNVLTRNGWTRDTLSIGDRVSVRAHPWRDGRPYGLVQSIDRDGGLGLAPRTATPDAPASTSTLAGIWRVDRSNLVVYPGGFDGYFRANLQLTEKAQAAQAEYVVFSDQNPELTCLGRPAPAAILQDGPYLIQIAINEDEETVTILNEFYDELRTVYMDGRTHPGIDERLTTGHSIGWWEGDTLVVDTTNFADHRSPYQIGVPSGAHKHVVERYRLAEGGTRAVVEFTLEDPEYIAEPFSDTRELIYSPDIPIYPFNCDTRSTSVFLPE